MKKISFIFYINDINKYDDLEITLNSLLKQNIPSTLYEIFILNDGANLKINDQILNFLNKKSFFNCQILTKEKMIGIESFVKELAINNFINGKYFVLSEVGEEFNDNVLFDFIDSCDDDFNYDMVLLNGIVNEINYINVVKKQNKKEVNILEEVKDNVIIRPFKSKKDKILNEEQVYFKIDTRLFGKIFNTKLLDNAWQWKVFDVLSIQSKTLFFELLKNSKTFYYHPVNIGTKTLINNMNLFKWNKNEKLNFRLIPLINNIVSYFIGENKYMNGLMLVFLFNAIRNCDSINYPLFKILNYESLNNNYFIKHKLIKNIKINHKILSSIISSGEILNNKENTQILVQN